MMNPIENNEKLDSADDDVKECSPADDQAEMFCSEEIGQGWLGDVQSNRDTIAALREGVGVAPRLYMLPLSGWGAVPLALTTTVVPSSGAMESKVVVLKDAIAVDDARQPGPRVITSDLQLHSLDAFNDYINQYKTSSTTAFLDARAQPPRVTAVLDYHRSTRDDVAFAGEGRWCRNRATYALELSRQWKTWLNPALEKGLTQEELADFIDYNSADFGSPTKAMPDAAPATLMISTARNLQILTKGTYERRINPRTGEGALVVKDEHETQSTPIPRGFVIAIPVFEGAAEKYPLEVRLMFRMATGRPVFGFVFQNREEVYEHAIEGVRRSVIDETRIPCYLAAAPAAIQLPG